jgi:hypothetical protein
MARINVCPYIGFDICPHPVIARKTKQTVPGSELTLPRNISLKGLARRRLLMTTLALFALLLQSVLPVASMIGGAAPQAAVAGDAAVICTPKGAIPLAEYLAAQNQAPVAPDHHDMSACQVCTPGLTGSFGLTPEAVFVSLVQGPVVSPVVMAHVWLDRRPVSSLKLRGPPTPV